MSALDRIADGSSTADPNPALTARMRLLLEACHFGAPDPPYLSGTFLQYVHASTLLESNVIRVDIVEITCQLEGHGIVRIDGKVRPYITDPATLARLNATSEPVGTGHEQFADERLNSIYGWSEDGKLVAYVGDDRGPIEVLQLNRYNVVGHGLTGHGSIGGETRVVRWCGITGATDPATVVGHFMMATGEHDRLEVTPVANPPHLELTPTPASLHAVDLAPLAAEVADSARNEPPDEKDHRWVEGASGLAMSMLHHVAAADGDLTGVFWQFPFVRPGDPPNASAGPTSSRRSRRVRRPGRRDAARDTNVVHFPDSETISGGVAEAIDVVWVFHRAGDPDRIGGVIMRLLDGGDTRNGFKVPPDRLRWQFRADVRYDGIAVGNFWSLNRRYDSRGTLSLTTELQPGLETPVITGGYARLQYQFLAQAQVTVPPQPYQRSVRWQRQGDRAGLWPAELPDLRVRLSNESLV